ncbi:hypothetical protein ACWI_07650 [Acetobacterium wieringae]|uniref:Uncharacterized protein n=2 Tax=Acetobacterium wieringae TaxID=52694 RepID=A0A1F2PM24_9FIRM|nr:hypothetical protein ACWI_07650 [Acetobacterium wieringae]
MINLILEDGTELKSFKIDEVDLKDIRNSNGNSIIDTKITEQISIELKKCEDNYIGTISVESKQIIDSNLRFNRCKRCEYLEESREIKKSCDEDLNNYSEKYIGKIVVVLESPHVKEYDFIRKGKRIPIPAIGNSGNSLQNNFEENFKRIFENDDIKDGVYSIILCNAIQYQCSLGVNTKKYRDRLFIVLWFMAELNKNFLKRIKSYQAAIVINLCTNGNHEKDPLIDKNKQIKPYLETEYKDNFISKYKKSTSIKNLKGLQRDVQYQINEIVKDNKACLFYSGSHPSIRKNWQIKKL